ncbi:MAG: hypothetical protein NZ480_03990 [Bdellovibrionaceae bacterium]|nr:hypothetical protein [Pseudobdellovibrionaceae bacterium]MDW8189995.1 hypothetical protein [Pseudobdellovibrionaceae bacterium]
MSNVETNVGVLKSFFWACRDFFIPRVFFGLILLPILSLLFWLVVFFSFGWDWVIGLDQFMKESTFVKWILSVLQIESLGNLTKIVAFVIIFLFFLPINYLTIVMLLSILGTPYLVKVIHQRYYPTLKKFSGPWLPLLWNTIWQTIVFVFLFVVTLPFWLLPGMQIFLPILLIGNYNRRIFTFDVLADFLNPDDIKAFQKKFYSDLILLGVLVGAISYLPFAFLLTPVLGALSFSHFCLSRVEEFQKGETS